MAEENQVNGSAWQAHLAAMREKERLLPGKRKPVIGSAYDGVSRYYEAIEIHVRPSKMQYVMAGIKWVFSALFAVGFILLLCWMPELAR